MISGASTELFAERIRKVRESMEQQGIDAVLLSVGHDLPWLIGYEAMPLERLTLLVVRRDGDARLLIPRLEAARVVPHGDVFSLVPWAETENPVTIAANLVRGASVIAVGDQMWSRFLIELQHEVAGVDYRRAVDVIGPHRIIKDPAEIEALRAAGQAVDSVAGQLQRGEIPLVGRTEADVSRDLSDRIIATGHQVVNFAIVASGPNAASPHHHASDRVIQPNEIVLCDFGGSMNGYCSDITRCVFTGDLDSAPEIADAYAVLQSAQAASVEAATIGVSCEAVDRAARQPIDQAGFGEYFIHRTGHGIGLEAHEDPYIVEGNQLPMEAGFAFSIEPGIYVDGRWGMRLEDIVVASSDGPIRCNNADHSLVPVDA